MLSLCHHPNEKPEVSTRTLLLRAALAAGILLAFSGEDAATADAAGAGAMVAALTDGRAGQWIVAAREGPACVLQHRGVCCILNEQSIRSNNRRHTAFVICKQTAVAWRTAVLGGHANSLTRCCMAIVVQSPR